MILVFCGLVINGWRVDSNKLEATERKLKNEIACAEGSSCWFAKLNERDRILREAEDALREQRALNKETEDALQTKLAEVDRRYLDAVQRLSRIRVCKPVPSAPAAPAAAGEPRPPVAVDEGDGASLAGLGPVLRDCELDAADYDALTQWYARLREIRNTEIDNGRD